MVLAPKLATLLVVDRALERADVIVVLAGSATYLERCEKAAAVFRQGVSNRILLTDDGSYAGWSATEQRTIPFLELAKRELQSRDVPASAIHLLGPPVAGTIEEARLMARTAMENEWQSIAIVTSAYHTRRALRTFERAFAIQGLKVRIGITSAPLGLQTPRPDWWWLGAAGWRDVAWEYVKSAYYYLMY